MTSKKGVAHQIMWRTQSTAFRRRTAGCKRVKRRYNKEMEEARK